MQRLVDERVVRGKQQPLVVVEFEGCMAEASGSEQVARLVRRLSDSGEQLFGWQIATHERQ